MQAFIRLAGRVDSDEFATGNGLTSSTAPMISSLCPAGANLTSAGEVILRGYLDDPMRLCEKASKLAFSIEEAPCGSTALLHAPWQGHSDFIQSHVLHFYHLTLPDFINGPGMPPWQPAWSTDKRCDAATTQALINSYLAALDIRRKAHEMGAVFGGRMPHPPTYIPGCFTEVPNSAQISKFKAYLTEILNFINNIYIPDIEKLSSLYSDYYLIGRGPGTLMAYGVFDLDAAGNSKLLRRGIAMNGSTAIQPVDMKAITKHVKYSWYADTTDGLNPDVGLTTGQYPPTRKFRYS